MCPPDGILAKGLNYARLTIRLALRSGLPEYLAYPAGLELARLGIVQI